MKEQRGEVLVCSGVTLYHVCPNDQLNKILTPDFFGSEAPLSKNHDIFVAVLTGGTLFIDELVPASK